MEHSNSQFTLFCLAMMLATLGYALYRIHSSRKTQDVTPEGKARWAILSAFVLCGVAFVQVAVDGRFEDKSIEAVEVEQALRIDKIVELGKPAQ